VFLDVDGTYVNDRGVVPASARRAVVRARANGHLVFLCTGRPLPLVVGPVADAGFDGIVASAGGYVEVAGTVLRHRHVAVPDVRHAVEFFDAHGVDFFLEANSGVYGSRHSRARLRAALFRGVSDADALAELARGLGTFIDSLVVDEDLVRRDINKISFFGSGLPLAAVRAEFAGRFDVIPASVSHFGPHSGEMSIPGVHKADGIEVLLEHVGMSREDAVGFGDSLNDLEMLAFVGTGIAMADARPEVKAVADGITPAPDDDGIQAGFAALGLI
jgi:Cof subfamily protein (haloacid dehalogenase superfamily)